MKGSPALIGSVAASRRKSGSILYPTALLNPGAETGNTSGWTARYSGGPLILSGNAASGTYYFAAGNTALGRWDQQLSVPTAQIADVDAGRVQAVATAKRAAFTDADVSGMYLQFFDASGRQIGGKFQPKTDPGNTSTPVWIDDTLRAWLPPGTRSYRFGVWQERAAGTESSTYYDDFAIALNTVDPAPMDHLLWILPSNDDVAAMTVVTATPLFQDAAPNVYAFSGLGAVQVGSYYIERALSPERFARIDAGTATFEWDFLAGNYPGGADTFRAQLQFYDAGGNPIAHAPIESGAALSAPPVNWVAYVRSGTVPVGARRVRMTYTAGGSSGVARDAYIGHMTLLVGAP